MVKRALISVSDKTGVVELARRLFRAGVEIISTGGTAAAIKDAGVPVTGISDVTGFPEILDGRVKTLHPAVHGALLARRDLEEHMKAIREHGIEPIDMVVVNLYPFRSTIQKPGVTIEEAVENIDIGGPSMIRSAAKNYKHVIVLANPNRYEEVLQYIESGKEVPEDLRLSLMVEAFEHTAAYDSLIAQYFGRMVKSKERFIPELILRFDKKFDLRYGENPHQKAAAYVDPLFWGPSVINAEQLHGIELSYNNIADADAALSLVLEFDVPCAVAVKHANPCGVGTAPTLEEAFRKAYTADPVSIFGGIVAFNRPVDARTADLMANILLDIVIAPGYDEEALKILRKKKNTRILAFTPGERPAEFDVKKVAGGLLVQDTDTLPLEREVWRVVTEREPTEAEMRDLKFGWKVVKYVKSNAIVLAKDGKTTGIGPGQPNRIDSARIAITRAGDEAKGSVLASDAFFPFPDVVEAAAAAGITAIAQPGGSMRDAESIKAANKAGISMVFTGTRHFRH